MHRDLRFQFTKVIKVIKSEVVRTLRSSKLMKTKQVSSHHSRNRQYSRHFSSTHGIVKQLLR